MSEAGQQHHGGHSLHVPGGSGGEGQSFAQLLGVGADGQGSHNFLSHLLGLDHDAHGHAGGLHGGDGASATPSQSTGWNSALQSVKISDALQGINVTPGFLFILLFLGFICWLYVIYWVRHHEPLANSVLGVGAPMTRMSQVDRQLLNGTKYAFPQHTTNETGDIYVPGVPESPVPSLSLSLDKAGSVQAAPLMPMPAPPIPPQPAPPPQPTPLSGNQAYLSRPARMQFAAQAPSGYGVLPAPGVYVPSFGQPAAQSAYLAPLDASGSRLRMFVNR
jgi:hypothetical protein